MTADNRFIQAPFIAIPPALFESGLNAAAIAVWCALARWVRDSRGHCWRTIADLAQDTKLSEATVQRAIRTLRKNGFLKVTLHRGAHSTYRLIWHGSDVVPMQTTDESDITQPSLANIVTVKPAQERGSDGKWHHTASGDSQRSDLYGVKEKDSCLFSLRGKQGRRDYKPPFFSEEQPAEKQSQEPKQTNAEEPGQNPEPKVKQTARQEQARAHAAADCTYGEDWQFHIGKVARAWLDRRNPEQFILDRLLEDDKIAREAAGPWEPIADPLGYVLELIEAWDRLYQANKVGETAKHKAVIEARKVARRQKWEQEHPQAIRQHGSLRDIKGSET